MDPQEQNLTVTFTLETGDVDVLTFGQIYLRQHAVQLVDDDPTNVGLVAKLARLTHKLALVAGVCRDAGRDVRGKDSATPKATGKASAGKRVKHVYSLAGICEQDHGQGKCAKVRERKPRAGAANAAAVEDTATLTHPAVV